MVRDNVLRSWCHCCLPGPEPCWPVRQNEVRHERLHLKRCRLLRIGSKPGNPVARWTRSGLWHYKGDPDADAHYLLEELPKLISRLQSNGDVSRTAEAEPGQPPGNPQRHVGRSVTNNSQP